MVICFGVVVAAMRCRTIRVPKLCTKTHCCPCHQFDLRHNNTSAHSLMMVTNLPHCLTSLLLCLEVHCGRDVSPKSAPVACLILHESHCAQACACCWSLVTSLISGLSALWHEQPGDQNSNTCEACRDESLRCACVRIYIDSGR